MCYCFYNLLNKNLFGEISLINTKKNKIIVTAGAGSISTQMRFFYESRKN